MYFKKYDHGLTGYLFIMWSSLLGYALMLWCKLDKYIYNFENELLIAAALVLSRWFINKILKGKRVLCYYWFITSLEDNIISNPNS